jgi:hypothetical protein
VARRAPVFPDAAWKAVVTAATPMKPDAQARKALYECIATYLTPLDLEQLHRTAAMWRDVHESARELSNKLLEIRRRIPDVDDPERPLRQLRAVKEVQFHAEKQLEGYRLLERGHDPTREWLWSRLFAIWIDHFGGKLTVGRAGPLARFVAAVFEQGLGEKMKVETFRDAARRERERRRIKI